MGPEVPRRAEKLPTVSSSVRRLTTSVWFHQRVPAWALRFPHCCCCSQCCSGSCTHRHHPADLLARSSNWVNNITLIRISEYVYTQNQKLTFHVSKKSQITGSLTGQIIPPFVWDQNTFYIFLPPRWTGLLQKWNIGLAPSQINNSKIILPIHGD